MTVGTIEIYDSAYDAAARADIADHLADDENPHSVTKTQVGLANVDNTADADKPVSTAQATALALKAALASPTFTGTPAAPTAIAGTATTQIATTAFAQAAANVATAAAAVAQADVDAHEANVSNPHSVTKTQVGLGNADNTSDANKPISSATQTALNTGTAATATVATNLATHTGSTSNPHSVTKTQVGLGSVDNTADTAKPVSTAQQTAINVVQTASDTVATNLATHAANTSNPHSVTKTQVGLGNADNTSDANKPVSSAQQTALNLKADIAGPTFTGVPAAPTAAPGTNTTQLATTAFSKAAGDVLAAATATVATNLATHAANVSNPHSTTKAQVGLGSVDNTADADKPVSTAQATALALKAPLASPALTGVPTVPTAIPGTNTTQASSTAYAKAVAVAGNTPFRPGDSVALYGTSLTGEASAALPVASSWVANSTGGAGVRVDAAVADDPQVIAPVAAFPIEAGRVYDVRYKVRRQTDPGDPLNDSVTLAIRWLDSGKAGIAGPTGITTVEDIPLEAADGVQERTARVALEDGDDVDFVAPAGAVYFRPYVEMFGDDHVTDVIVIGHWMAAVTGLPFAEITEWPATPGETRRSLVARHGDLADVRDYGVIGDGAADDTAALIAMFDDVPVGTTIRARRGDRFLISSEITLPAGRKYRFEGARFQFGGDLTTTNILMYLGADDDTVGMEIDALLFDILDGASFRRFVDSLAPEVRIDLVELIAETQISQGVATGALLDNFDAAFKIGGNYSRVGTLRTRKINVPFLGYHPDDGLIGFRFDDIDVEDYTHGIRFRNCKDVAGNRVRAEVASPNAAAVAGNNGVLLTSCQDVQIKSGIVSNSGEHAYRVGGTNENEMEMKNIQYGSLIANYPGQCAFKANPDVGQTIVGLTLDSLLAVDCAATSSTGSNESLLRLEQVIGFNVGRAVGRRDIKGNSCFSGVELFGCSHGLVGFVDVDTPHRAAVDIRVNNDGSEYTHDVTVAHVQWKGKPLFGVVLDLEENPCTNVRILDIAGEDTEMGLYVRASMATGSIVRGRFTDQDNLLDIATTAQKATAAAIAAGGTNYVNGDTITLTGGTSTSAVVLTVTNAVLGIIQAGGVSITTAGNYTEVPANPVAQGSTSGIGAGATFNITWATGEPVGLYLDITDNAERRIIGRNQYSEVFTAARAALTVLSGEGDPLDPDGTPPLEGLLLRSSGVPALGEYGAPVLWTKRGSQRIRAGICAIQTEADEDQMGVDILTHQSTASDNDTLNRAFRVGHEGTLSLYQTSDPDAPVKIFNGTGSPEGVQTAAVGSMFLRRDGGVGTTLYIKQTGTGNTGWAAK